MRLRNGALNQVRKKQSAWWSSISTHSNENPCPSTRAEEDKPMNIGKKLYLSFGGVLTTVVILAAVILFAVYREHETKAAAQRSMDMTQATSLVRFEMMQNRLHLQNYLLSGDTRDVEKMNEGVRHLAEALKRAQGLAKHEQQHTSTDNIQQLDASGEQ